MTRPYYYETAGFNSKWRPQSSNTRPETKAVAGVERLKTSEGVGPRIRSIEMVERGHEKLTLNQMQRRYSPDGCFRNI